MSAFAKAAAAMQAAVQSKMAGPVAFRLATDSPQRFGGVAAPAPTTFEVSGVYTSAPAMESTGNGFTGSIGSQQATVWLAPAEAAKLPRRPRANDGVTATRIDGTTAEGVVSHVSTSDAGGLTVHIHEN